MKTKSVKVKTFKRIKGNILINGSIWLSKLDYTYLFNNIGIKPSLFLLTGATLQCQSVDVEAGEVITHNDREITFQNAGTKHLDWELVVDKSPILLSKLMSQDIENLDMDEDEEPFAIDTPTEEPTVEEPTVSEVTEEPVAEVQE